MNVQFVVSAIVTLVLTAFAVSAQETTPKAAIIAQAGPFVLLSGSAVTVPVRQKMCEQIGGWLAMYETSEENALVQQLLPRIPTSAIVDGYAAEVGVFKRRYGPHAGKMISIGNAPNTDCKQTRCFWNVGTSEPNGGDAREAEPLIEVNRGNGGWWNDVPEGNSVAPSLNLNTLCQTCDTSEKDCMPTTTPAPLLPAGARDSSTLDGDVDDKTTTIIIGLSVAVVGLTVVVVGVVIFACTRQSRRSAEGPVREEGVVHAAPSPVVGVVVQQPPVEMNEVEGKQSLD